MRLSVGICQVVVTNWGWTKEPTKSDVTYEIELVVKSMYVS